MTRRILIAIGLRQRLGFAPVCECWRRTRDPAGTRPPGGKSTAEAQAHDSWISKGGHRNAAGEWCCGEGDCEVIDATTITVTDRGYKLSPSETVPYREAQPSPDGQFWRCHRPDGSRRCFFAPPPGS